MSWLKFYFNTQPLKLTQSFNCCVETTVFDTRSGVRDSDSQWLEQEVLNQAVHSFSFLIGHHVPPTPP